MPPSASKSSLSPAELAQLEHAFATDPQSDAYRPLAEAYLAMGRFMEAMVVCKKGVKAHPDTATARVLLARVYADQGKDRKALEELQNALQVAPADAPALRMAGSVLCKLGDIAAGSEHLKKAIAADPKNAETLEACKKWNVALPPPEPVVVPAPQAAAPTMPRAAPAPPPPPLAAQPLVPAAAVPIAAGPIPTVSSGRPPAGPPVLQPAATRTVAHPPPRAPYNDFGHRLEEDSAKPKKSPTASVVATVAIILVGALGLGFYYHQAKEDAIRAQKIDALLKQVRAELDHDSYAGYKKACETGEKIVNEIDNKLFSAHAYLAYAYVLRWGEHGEGENIEKLAREHLERAKAAKQEHSHILAADAYLSFFAGDTKGSEEALEKVVEENEQKGKKSTLLMGTLGILQMHAGDLEKAYKNLKAAQTLSPSDPRLNAALGDVLRRQGNEFLAANAYETALRYEKDHAEAQLGVALMAIDTGKLEAAEKFVKKLLTADPPPSPRQIAMAHLAFAIVLDEQGKTTEADKEQALAFETDSRNAELYILKARRLKRVNKLDEAVASVREAIRRDSRRASFYVELARALIAKPGGAREAVTSMEQALRTMPGSPKLLVLLGDSYRAADDPERARDSYEKALAGAKDKAPEARLALADLARAKKDLPKALDLYEKAKSEFLSSPKKQAYALTEMGKIYEEQGDRKRALDSYKAAASADFAYAPPLFLMARFFTADKDKARRERAFALLDQYVELDPQGEYVEEAKRLLAERRK